MFCPVMSSRRLARHYGVSYVLAPDWKSHPSGMRLITTYGIEGLYKVPGGGIVTLESTDQAPDDAKATVVPVSFSSPSSMRMTTTSTHPTELYVHVRDTPGWHVSVDGRSVRFDSWDCLMIRLDLSTATTSSSSPICRRAFSGGLSSQGSPYSALSPGAWSRGGELTSAASRSSDGASTSAFEG